jgi:CheY-like chemotaxis protein
MYRQPPLFSRPVLDGKKVLLIDANQATRDVRAEVLRDHGLMVHAVEDLSGARVLWQSNFYDLILLNLRRHSPGEAFQFYEQVKDASP